MAGYQRPPKFTSSTLNICFHILLRVHLYNSNYLLSHFIKRTIKLFIMKRSLQIVADFLSNINSGNAALKMAEKFQLLIKGTIYS